MDNKITIYRGSHQIGGCVTEIKTANHRILIDFGANLPGSKADDVMTDEELLHTVFDGEPCDGVLFTHYHGDHIGLYKKIPKDIPLYIGSTAKKILEILTEKLDSIPHTVEKGLPRVQGMNAFSPGEKISKFGDIRVTPFVVGHSALDAYMFLIEIDGKKILFTGDFREHGIAGKKRNGILFKRRRIWGSVPENYFRKTKNPLFWFPLPIWTVLWNFIMPCPGEWVLYAMPIRRS